MNESQLCFIDCSSKFAFIQQVSPAMHGCFAEMMPRIGVSNPHFHTARIVQKWLTIRPTK